MLANFIWSGRRPKIKNSTLIAAIEDGGLKLVDLHSKIKATYITWIQRCLKGSVHPIVINFCFIILNLMTLLHSLIQDLRYIKNPIFQRFTRTYIKQGHKLSIRIY